jgi:hypothetical protein
MAVTLNASTSSGLVQTADTSGTVEIQSNGTTRLTVASGGVTATNLTATGTFGGGVITAGTAVSASSTSVDFTSIPSWVKRITVMFNVVSTNGSSDIQLQIGSGSVTTSGYVGATAYVNVSGSSGTNFSAGFLVSNSVGSGNTYSGIATLCLLSSNKWIFSIAIGRGDNTTIYSGGGVSSTLSGALDRVRITTANGTDTFDAGTINILYEG